MATTLLDGIIADGDGPVVRADEFTQSRGAAVIGVRSTDFGGGTVTCYIGSTEVKADMYPAENGTWTESMAKLIEVPHNWYVNLRLSGATSPDAVTAEGAGD